MVGDSLLEASMTTPKPAPAADPQQSASSAQGEEKCPVCGISGSHHHSEKSKDEALDFFAREIDSYQSLLAGCRAQLIATDKDLTARNAQLTQLRAELEEARNDYEQRFEYEVHRQGDSLRSDLALAREALRRAVEAMPDWDCGSNSCRFAKIKGGMRTNGGCTCLEEIRNAPKARMAFARIASVLSTLTTKEGKE
mgnify:CR=1 FL=1